MIRGEVPDNRAAARKPVHASTAVNLAAMADADDKDRYGSVANLADEAPVADAVFPEPSEFAAMQCLTEAARIGLWRDALAQEGQ